MFRTETNAWKKLSVCRTETDTEVIEESIFTERKYFLK